MSTLSPREGMSLMPQDPVLLTPRASELFLALQRQHQPVTAAGGGGRQVEEIIGSSIKAVTELQRTYMHTKKDDELVERLVQRMGTVGCLVDHRPTEHLLLLKDRPTPTNEQQQQQLLLLSDRTTPNQRRSLQERATPTKRLLSSDRVTPHQRLLSPPHVVSAHRGVAAAAVAGSGTAAVAMQPGQQLAALPSPRKRKADRNHHASLLDAGRDSSQGGLLSEPSFSSATPLIGRHGDAKHSFDDLRPSVAQQPLAGQQSGLSSPSGGSWQDQRPLLRLGVSSSGPPAEQAGQKASGGAAARASPLAQRGSDSKHDADDDSNTARLANVPACSQSSFTTAAVNMTPEERSDRANKLRAANDAKDARDMERTDTQMLGDQPVSQEAMAGMWWPRRWSAQICNSPDFELVVVFLILVNTVVLCLHDPMQTQESPHNKLLSYFEIALNALFTVEVILRVLSIGSVSQYLSKPWNVFDVSMVLAGYTIFIPDSGSSFVRAIRALRALRILRLIVRFESLRGVVVCFFEAIPMLMTVIYLLVIIIFVFAVAGVQLFMNVYHNTCEDPNGAMCGQPGCLLNAGDDPDMFGCGGYGSCPSGYECMVTDHSTSVNTANFDNVVLGMIVMFQCFTISGWSFIMYRSMDGASPAASIFYISFECLMQYFMIQLFLAVLKAKFAKAQRIFLARSQLRQAAKKKNSLSKLFSNVSSHMSGIASHRSTASIMESHLSQMSRAEVEPKDVDRDSYSPPVPPAVAHGSPRLKQASPQGHPPMHGGETDDEADQRLMTVRRAPEEAPQPPAGTRGSPLAESTQDPSGHGLPQGSHATLASSVRRAHHALPLGRTTDVGSSVGQVRRPLAEANEESLLTLPARALSRNLSKAPDYSRRRTLAFADELEDTQPLAVAAQTPRAGQRSSSQQTSFRVRRRSSQLLLSTSTETSAHKQLLEGVGGDDGGATSAVVGTADGAATEAGPSERASGPLLTAAPVRSAMKQRRASVGDNGVMMIAPEGLSNHYVAMMVMSAEEFDEYVADRPFFTRCWYRLQYRLRFIVTQPAFSYLFLLVIMVNTILMTLDYDDCPQGYADALEEANYVMTAFFTVEVLLKMAGLGFWDFWADYWNWFDVLVVATSLVEIVLAHVLDSSVGTLNILRVLRALRVLRILKVFNYVAALRKVFEVLFASFTSFMAVLTLLGLFWFVFAIIGLHVFGGLVLVPYVFPNYNTFLNSLVSTFNILAVENMQNQMYSVARATNYAVVLFFISWVVIGKYVLLGLFLAVVLEAFEAKYDRRAVRDALGTGGGGSQAGSSVTDGTSSVMSSMRSRMSYSLSQGSHDHHTASDMAADPAKPALGEPVPGSALLVKGSIEAAHSSEHDAARKRDVGAWLAKSGGKPPAPLAGGGVTDSASSHTDAEEHLDKKGTHRTLEQSPSGISPRRDKADAGTTKQRSKGPVGEAREDDLFAALSSRDPKASSESVAVAPTLDRAARRSITPAPPTLASAASAPPAASVGAASAALSHTQLLSDTAAPAGRPYPLAALASPSSPQAVAAGATASAPRPGTDAVAVSLLKPSTPGSPARGTLLPAGFKPPARLATLPAPTALAGRSNGHVDTPTTLAPAGPSPARPSSPPTTPSRRFRSSLKPLLDMSEPLSRTLTSRDGLAMARTHSQVLPPMPALDTASSYSRTHTPPMLSSGPTPAPLRELEQPLVPAAEDMSLFFGSHDGPGQDWWMAVEETGLLRANKTRAASSEGNEALSVPTSKLFPASSPTSAQRLLQHNDAATASEAAALEGAAPSIGPPASHVAQLPETVCDSATEVTQGVSPRSRSRPTSGILSVSHSPSRRDMQPSSPTHPPNGSRTGGGGSSSTSSILHNGVDPRPGRSPAAVSPSLMELEFVEEPNSRLPTGTLSRGGSVRVPDDAGSKAGASRAIGDTSSGLLQSFSGLSQGLWKRSRFSESPQQPDPKLFYSNAVFDTDADSATAATHGVASSHTRQPPVVPLLVLESASSAAARFSASSPPSPPSSHRIPDPTATYGSATSDAERDGDLDELERLLSQQSPGCPAPSVPPASRSTHPAAPVGGDSQRPRSSRLGAQGDASSPSSPDGCRPASSSSSGRLQPSSGLVKQNRRSSLGGLAIGSSSMTREGMVYQLSRGSPRGALQDANDSASDLRAPDGTAVHATVRKPGASGRMAGGDEGDEEEDEPLPKRFGRAVPDADKHHRSPRRARLDRGDDALSSDVVAVVAAPERKSSSGLAPPERKGSSGLGSVTPRHSGDGSVASTTASAPPGEAAAKTHRRHIDKSVIPFEGKAFWMFCTEHRLRRRVYRLVNSKWFDNVMFFFVLANCLAMAFEHPGIERHSAWGEFIFWSDVAFTLLFTIEAALKIFAFTFNLYIRKLANQVDFAIVLVSFVTIISECVAAGQGWTQALSILKVFKPLRTLTRSRSMQLVFKSLTLSLAAMAHVSLVLFIFFLIFAILGTQLFKGRLYICNDPDVADESECIDMFIEVDGVAVHRHWGNQFPNFDNVGNSLLVCFFTATLNGFTATMWATMNAPNAKGVQPTEGNMSLAFLWYLGFAVIMSFTLINLYIGVIYSQFSKMRLAGQAGSAFLTQEQQEFAELSKMVFRLRLPDKLVVPHHPLRRKLFRLVMHRAFDYFMMAVVMLNIVALAMVWWHQPDSVPEALELANIGFTSIYILEAVFKIVALGWQAYWRNGWNKFDLLLVMVGLVDIIVTYISTASNAFLNIQKLLRLARIARMIKLMKSASGVKQMVKTLMAALPAFGNVGALLGLFFFMYSYIGVWLLGEVEHIDNINRWANFDNFLFASMTLFRIATGDNWANVLLGALPHEAVPGSTLDNHGTYAAIPYIISFYILIPIIMVNLFTTVIIETFDKENEQDAWKLSPQALDDFVTLWAEYDDGTGTISTSALEALLLRLEPPLGLGPVAVNMDVLRFVYDLDIPLVKGRVPFHKTAFELVKRCSMANIPDGVLKRQIDALVERFFKNLQQDDQLNFSVAVVVQKIQRRWRTRMRAARLRRKIMWRSARMADVPSYQELCQSTEQTGNRNEALNLLKKCVKSDASRWKLNPMYDALGSVDKDDGWTGGSLRALTQRGRERWRLVRSKLLKRPPVASGKGA